MENWVGCLIFPCQFSGEVGVEGRQFDGTLFSLVVPEEQVDYGMDPG